MDNKIKIGIPRGLYYYKYNILWKEFFKELGCDIIVSPETNFEILENGKKYSASEMCLSLKIYIGHFFYLKDKVDYVLVPRIVCEKINSESCTNFIALYDIINNTFDVNILNYNVDERKIFLRMKAGSLVYQLMTFVYLFVAFVLALLHIEAWIIGIIFGLFLLQTFLGIILYKHFEKHF